MAAVFSNAPLALGSADGFRATTKGKPADTVRGGRAPLQNLAQSDPPVGLYDPLLFKCVQLTQKQHAICMCIVLTHLHHHQ